MSRIIWSVGLVATSSLFGVGISAAHVLVAELESSQSSRNEIQAPAPAPLVAALPIATPADLTPIEPEPKQIVSLGNANVGTASGIDNGGGSGQLTLKPRARPKNLTASAPVETVAPSYTAPVSKPRQVKKKAASPAPKRNTVSRQATANLGTIQPANKLMKMPAYQIGVFW